jgi:nucleotide-binding universal stress UspA family protein
MRILYPLLALAVALPAAAADKIRVVIIDGQNNHNWKATTPVLKKHLEDAGLFEVTVATSPEKGKKDEMEKFAPDLSKYDVLVSNYNGEPWGKPLTSSTPG